jgi:ABC-type phosphate/phosphonate transport system permease subunit
VRESSEYPTLWKTFSSTIWTLALSTIVSLLCLVFDRDSSPSRWFAIPFVFVLLLSLLRISRTSQKCTDQLDCQSTIKQFSRY